MGKFVYRPDHRSHRNGKRFWVRGNFAYRSDLKDSKNSSTTNICPHCGESIRTRQMKGGGYGHFEGGDGLHRVKHRCFNQGDRLSKDRPLEMEDLFDEEDL